MSTLEKIKTLLSSKEESKETKMYAEMILDDGRVLATEDDQFMIGSVVMVVGDDGETSKLSAGSYTMSDGLKLTVDEDSKILDMGEDKAAEDVEAEKEDKEEMEHEPGHDSEADVADWAGMEKRIKNLEDAVADLKADKESLSVKYPSILNPFTLPSFTLFQISWLLTFIFTNHVPTGSLLKPKEFDLSFFLSSLIQLSTTVIPSTGTLCS